MIRMGPAEQVAPYGDNTGRNEAAVAEEEGTRKAYVRLVGEKCSLSLCKTPKHKDFSSYIFTCV